MHKPKPVAFAIFINLRNVYPTTVNTNALFPTKSSPHSQIDNSINPFLIFLAILVLHCKRHDILYIQCAHDKLCVSHVTCICLPDSLYDWTHLGCAIYCHSDVILNSTLSVLARACCCLSSDDSLNSNQVRAFVVHSEHTKIHTGFFVYRPHGTLSKTCLGKRFFCIVFQKL